MWPPTFWSPIGRDLIPAVHLVVGCRFQTRSNPSKLEELQASAQRKGPVSRASSNGPNPSAFKL